MNITAIPFHTYLGLEFAEPPYLLQLKAQPHHANHLGTIHASVLIALAEAGSGQFLMNHLGDGRPHAPREEAETSRNTTNTRTGSHSPFHHAERDDNSGAGNSVFPVIRRIEAKFHEGGQGTVYARCTLDPASLSTVRNDLEVKHRAKILVPMQVVDAQGTLLLSVSFDWFIQQA
ncbi:MAG TPA: hypothetical protein PLN21_03490 [Gemmatales bacterium]|nr:hypothetical protein [Gemmatales bacterium]